MIEQILAAVKRLGIEKYYINERKKESAECFFIRRKMDLNRRTDTTDYHVTVFHEFEKDGEKKLGSSAVPLYPGMDASEIETSLSAAYHSASFVSNPFYELYQGKKEDFIPSSSGFKGKTLAVIIRETAKALFLPDTNQTVFINSAELFAEHVLHHIVSSGGVDVSYETWDVTGEYVIQCTEPQDVETYHHFFYREPDYAALSRDVEEALKITAARAQATSAPEAGEYKVILSGEDVSIFLDYYLSRSGSGMIYQKYSNFETGAQVQGEHPEGDGITIRLKAAVPYSDEGIPLKDRVLMEDGVLKTIHGGNRFAQYLGIEPTGNYHGCISVATGSKTLEEMKSGKYLHVISFSDFQMDSDSGHFGGEIRLAFLSDGKTVTPVTGGSINGSVFDVQNHLFFSKETYKNGDYEGPFAVCFEGIKVAGN